MFGGGGCLLSLATSSTQSSWFGRRSTEAPEVAAGQFTALEVPAAEGGVSRIHAGIKIAGRAVLATDRSSAKAPPSNRQGSTSGSA